MLSMYKALVLVPNTVPNQTLNQKKETANERVIILGGYSLYIYYFARI